MPPMAFTIIHSLHPQLVQLAVPFANCPAKGGGEIITAVAVEVQFFASVIVTI